MKLALSVPWNHEDVPWHFLATLWGSDIPKNEDVVICRGTSHDITHARNMTIGKALEWGADEILLLDVDQHIPKDVLKRLRANNKEIVGCLTPMRSPPHRWSLFNAIPGADLHVTCDPYMPLQEVGATGIGCMLVRRDVFVAIGKPWFKRTFAEDGLTISKSDDVWFCEQARKAGYKVYVDTTLESGHEHTVTLNAEYLKRPVKYLEVFENVRA